MAENGVTGIPFSVASYALLTMMVVDQSATVGELKVIASCYLAGRTADEQLDQLPLGENHKRRSAIHVCITQVQKYYKYYESKMP